MPDVNKRISDMERATSVAPSTLFFASIADETSESGYSTRAAELQVVAMETLLNMEFASDLETTAKQIIPAINEAAKSGGGGGEGTTVVANPEDEATDTLSKIKIGDVVYSLETVDLPSAESEEGF